jgi:predicted RNA-binding Zn-ribbon protein involved in translation (DUF1610 family)
MPPCPENCWDAEIVDVEEFGRGNLWLCRDCGFERWFP